VQQCQATDILDPRSRAGERLACAALLVVAASSPACTLISKLGTDLSGEEFGKTYYLGGAGTLGHVGTIDVPSGLPPGPSAETKALYRARL
jgi:hypothetical protein